jgi:hypothetical protein
MNGGSGAVDSPAGRAWSITTFQRAGVADVASASRPLSGSLAVGQTISCDIGNADPIFEAGQPGFGQQWFSIEDTQTNPLGESDIFNFYATASSPNYVYLDGDGISNLHDSGIPLTLDGLRLAFTLTSQNTYSLTVTSLVNPNIKSTLTGVVDSLPINQIAFWNSDGGPSLSHALFFNNIAVSPEPTSANTLFLLLLVLQGSEDCDRVQAAIRSFLHEKGKTLRQLPSSSWNR